MTETVTFGGITFRRYPDAPGRSERVYFTPSGSHRKRGVGRLHEEIWKAAHGPIPDGHHIHHADHDPLNNDLANLVCLSSLDHGREHSPPTKWPEQLRACHDLAVQRAAAWHRSDEGRAQHSLQARRQWAEREATERRCERCGGPYGTRSLNRQERFCSDRCRTAARKASGVDNEARTCPGCGQVFHINKYKPTKACSRTCAWVLRKAAAP